MKRGTKVGEYAVGRCASADGFVQGSAEDVWKC